MVDEKKIIDLLDEFDIDPNFGFLLRDPLIKLPDPYQPWHDIAGKIHINFISLYGHFNPILTCISL